MQFTDKELSDFIEICRTAFGRDLTREEARTIAARYLHLLDVLANPGPAHPQHPLLPKTNVSRRLNA
jgi:hypothetical protein